MKTLTKLNNEINTICELFNLGELLRYKIKNHSLEGFKIANFETNLGKYEYIYRN